MSTRIFEEAIIAGKSTVLVSEQIEQPPSLVTIITKKLREQIESGRLKMGDRLPTEAEVSAAYGVSRTVVREAVSSLREAGLISTHRGRGSVVIAHSPSPTFSITGDELESSTRLRHLNEFRLIVETQIVGLAAQRRTDADIKAIYKALDMGAGARSFEEAIQADIAFHVSLAQAAHNEYFYRIMCTLRSVTTARPLMREDLDDAAYLALYASVLQKEHLDIVKAVESGSMQAARAKLEKHLVGKRYQAFIDMIDDNQA